MGLLWVLPDLGASSGLEPFQPSGFAPGAVGMLLQTDGWVGVPKHKSISLLGRNSSAGVPAALADNRPPEKEGKVRRV